MAIIPKIGISYLHVSPEKYTENGIGALKIAVDNMDLFRVQAGVTMATKMNLENGVLSPKLRLFADWDVTQQKAVVNTSWAITGGSVTPMEGAEPTALGAIIGTGIEYASNDGTYVLSLDYDCNTRADFISHSASAKFRVNF